MINLNLEYVATYDEFPHFISIGWQWPERTSGVMTLHLNWRITDDLVDWCNSMIGQNNFKITKNDSHLVSIEFKIKKEATLFMLLWQAKPLMVSQFNLEAIQ